MFRKLILAFGGRWLTGQLKAARAGELGPQPQKALLFLEGRKTELSFLFGVVVIPSLLALGYSDAATWAAMLAGAGVSAGIIDRNYRQEVSPEILGSSWYRFLRNHGADVVAFLGTSSLAVQACSAETSALLVHLHLTCTQASMILAALTAVAAHLGLSASALLAQPPTPGGLDSGPGRPGLQLGPGAGPTPATR